MSNAYPICPICCSYMTLKDCFTNDQWHQCSCGFHAPRFASKERLEELTILYYQLQEERHQRNNLLIPYHNPIFLQKE